MFVYTDFGMDVVERLDEVGLNTSVFYENPEDELDVAVVFRSRKTEKKRNLPPRVGDLKCYNGLASVTFRGWESH